MGNEIIKIGEAMKLCTSMSLLVLFLMHPQNICASETASNSLPPELMKLQSQGQLTVRALWAWKLVPESTAGMVLEFRTLGYDLLGANKEQLTIWLKQAEEGQLQLNARQRDTLSVLADRMASGTGAAGSETAQVDSVDNKSTETKLAAQEAPSSITEEKVIDVHDSSAGKGIDSTDTAQMLANLGAQAEAGNSRAMLTLALISKTAVAGPPDPYRSIKLLEEAAAAGEADAKAALADEYESGLWVKQDVEKAKQLRQQAAEAGSQLAQWGVE